MGHQVLTLAVVVALVCVAQGLKCNYCMNVNKEHPGCGKTEERECNFGLNKCIALTMNDPASGNLVGEVRGCASDHQCEAKVPPLVERTCCDTDLCN